MTMPHQQIFPHGTHTTEGVQVHERHLSTRAHFVSSVVMVAGTRVHLRIWSREKTGRNRLEVPLTLVPRYVSMVALMTDVHRMTPVTYSQVVTHIGTKFDGTAIIDNYGRPFFHANERREMSALLRAYRRAVRRNPAQALRPIVDVFARVPE